jgi:hypothetical protein
MTLPQVTETDWQPGDPIHEPEVVSYDITVNRTYGPCPPNCWHRHPGSYGYGMRWSPEWPVLRFLPYRGLIVTGPEPHMIYRGVA